MLIFVVCDPQLYLRLVANSMDDVTNLLHRKHAWLLKPLRVEILDIGHIVSFELGLEVEIKLVLCEQRFLTLFITLLV